LRESAELRENCHPVNRPKTRADAGAAGPTRTGDLLITKEQRN
jgi:hypothetical protein